MLLLVLGIVARVVGAPVPAFALQTGLACNQCHVSWTNAADFTFTGMKFRLNGYRLPRAPEARQAGTDGAIGRRHLARTLLRMLSVRARATFAQRSKAPSDPTLSAPDAGPVTSHLIGPLDLDVGGPIGEHVGIWSDFCAYRASDMGIAYTEATCEGPGGYIGLSHLALQITTNDNGNIFGFGGSLVAGGRAHSFMEVTPATAPNHQAYTGGGGSPYMLYGVYAFLADRVGVKLSLEPGADNLDFKRFNYRVEGGIFPLWHRDAGWLLLGWMLRGGNDMAPGVAGVPGVTALTKGSVGYGSASTTRGLRMLYSLGYGFSGRGPHGFVGTLNWSAENEDYTDGGRDRLRAVGANLRYSFQRQYGVDVYVYEVRKWDYTDPTGVKHPIPLDPGFALRLSYSLPESLAFYVEAANTQSARLDQNWRQGNYWNVNLQFLW